MSKLIYVCGPSFGGKTRFAHILTQACMDIGLSVSNLSFELLYGTINRDYEKEFYKLIDSKLEEKKDVVIAESVMFNKRKARSAVEVLLYPPLEMHEEFYECYKAKFGEADARRRIYYSSIKEARDAFSKSYRSDVATQILWNCNPMNEKETIREVMIHVAS